MFWEYDSRIGRRWNVDPIYKEYISNYSTFGNNPIIFSDPNGADWVAEKVGKNTYTPTWKEDVHNASQAGKGNKYWGKSKTYQATDGSVYNLKSDGKFDIITPDKGPSNQTGTSSESRPASLEKKRQDGTEPGAPENQKASDGNPKAPDNSQGSNDQPGGDGGPINGFLGRPKPDFVTVSGTFTSPAALLSLKSLEKIIPPAGIALLVQYSGTNVSTTLDRNGNLYLSAGIAGGYKVKGVTVMGNWVCNRNGTPTEDQIKNTIIGTSVSISRGYWAGASFTWDTKGKPLSYGFGYNPPGGGVTYANTGTPITKIPSVKW